MPLQQRAKEDKNVSSSSPRASEGRQMIPILPSSSMCPPYKHKDVQLMSNNSSRDESFLVADNMWKAKKTLRTLIFGLAWPFSIYLLCDLHLNHLVSISCFIFYSNQQA